MENLCCGMQEEVSGVVVLGGCHFMHPLGVHFL